MFYGVYGDSNSDDPEVIGEASWLLARACFPKDNLSGNSGHENADVTCKYIEPFPPPATQANDCKTFFLLAMIQFYPPALLAKTISPTSAHFAQWGIN